MKSKDSDLRAHLSLLLLVMECTIQVDMAEPSQSKGKKDLISARDLNPILKTCEFAIVLSCSGGTPVLSQPESGEGIWAGIVGMGPNSALLCTWDVDVEATLAVIEYLLHFERSKFSSALSDVKRAMVRNEKYYNPYFWAGIEYWGAV